MKTSPQPVPVLLVGGGAVVAPAALRGASRVLRPPFAGVANAIGAAMAGVSGVVDAVVSTEKKARGEWLEELKGVAVERAVAAGAERAGVRIAEVEELPLQYVVHKSRFVVRAAGEFDYGRSEAFEVGEVGGEDDQGGDEEMGEYEKGRAVAEERERGEEGEVFDFEAYRPRVEERVWYISERDLAWISTGCYILGTGGGGSPYSSMLRLRSMLRAGAVVRVVSPDDLKDDDRVGCGGGAGSPTVGIEKLAGDE